MVSRVLHDRNMRILLVGQTLNMFGNTAMTIVLAIWVKDLTHSNGEAGLIFLLNSISSFFAPLTGLFVDRFPRRAILLWTDVVCGVIIATLVFVHHSSQVWLIYLITFLYGISGQIYRASRSGLIHSMVKPENLGDAQGLFGSLAQGMRIIGPLAGAAAYTAFGGGTVAIADTVTFFISALSYVLLRGVADLKPVKEPGEAKPRGEFLREVSLGIRHVFANPVIRRVVLAVAIAFIGAGMIDVAIFALVDSGLHRTTEVIGVIGSVQGFGSVIAGLVVGKLIRRVGEYATIAIGLLLNGAGLALCATASFPGVLVGVALIGIGLPMILVGEITLLQRRTPNDMQGRVLTASDAVIDIPFALAIGVGAIIINAVGFRAIYIATAIAFTLVGLWMLPYLKTTPPTRDEDSAAEGTAELAANDSAFELAVVPEPTDGEEAPVRR